jgi:glycosyltransferase involved in cell wall biosynthesis
MPVYEEGAAVVPVLRALEAAVVTPHETIVVYDFDEDGTVPPVRALAAELPAVRLLRNDLGRGVLHAMQAGIAASRGSWVLVTMADGSDDPAVVEPMVALARGGAHLVAASRYMRGGSQQGGPLVKRTLSRLAGLTLHWFAGVPIHDATNNFKLYGRDFLAATTIESTAGFELALELTVKATLDRRPMAEIPATWRDRTAGESRFRLRAWLPHYLRWYRAAFVGQGRRLTRRRLRR